MSSGTCGKNLTWTFDDGTLTISGHGAMKNYKQGLSPWYNNRNKIKRIFIKDGVTFIDKFAFSYCSALTEIELPDSITSISYRILSSCFGLTCIELPNSVKFIRGEAFYNCSSLTQLKLSDSLTFMGNLAFAKCSSLTSVILPPRLKGIGEKIFQGCTALKKIYYKRGTKIDVNSLKVGNKAKLIPYDEFPPELKAEESVAESDKADNTKENVKPPAQIKPSFKLTPLPTQASLFDSPPPAETNCTVYRNTKISRAENIAPPNTKILSRVDENIAEIRKAAELAAMNIVMTIERNLGFVPVDVSSQNLGYDIKSTSRDGKISRLIEVKGRHIDAETVTVSRNEIITALNNPDNFILAIVKLDADKNETIYLKRPFEQPPDKAALSVNFSIQKLVEAAQIIPR